MINPVLSIYLGGHLEDGGSWNLDCGNTHWSMFLRRFYPQHEMH